MKYTITLHDNGPEILMRILDEEKQVVQSYSGADPYSALKVAASAVADHELEFMEKTYPGWVSRRQKQKDWVKSKNS